MKIYFILIINKYITVSVTILMNSHEFKEIVDPKTIKLSAQQLWNFKRKAATYTLSESETDKTV